MANDELLQTTTASSALRSRRHRRNTILSPLDSRLYTPAFSVGGENANTRLKTRRSSIRSAPPQLQSHPRSSPRRRRGVASFLKQVLLDPFDVLWRFIPFRKYILALLLMLGIFLFVIDVALYNVCSIWGTSYTLPCICPRTNSLGVSLLCRVPYVSLTSCSSYRQSVWSSSSRPRPSICDRVRDPGMDLGESFVQHNGKWTGINRGAHALKGLTADIEFFQVAIRELIHLVRRSNVPHGDQVVAVLEAVYDKNRELQKKLRRYNAFVRGQVDMQIYYNRYLDGQMDKILNIDEE